MLDVKAIIEEHAPIQGRCMNAADARRLVEKCWGDYGAIEERYDDPRGTRFRVGTKGAPDGRRGYGVGDCWEAAFADAARRCRAQLRLVG